MTLGIDKKSREWMIVARWANSELEKYRAALEIPGTDLPLTEGYRASIRTLNELLALSDNNPHPEVRQSSTGYGIGIRI